MTHRAKENFEIIVKSVSQKLLDNSIGIILINSLNLKTLQCNFLIHKPSYKLKLQYHAEFKSKIK